jgi:MFS family permease
MVAASCMVLYGYDASVYNSVQGSANWLAWFDHPEKNTQLIGGVNTAYTVGAIAAGWFLGGPIVSFDGLVAKRQLILTMVQADRFGRRVGMAFGAFLTIIATFIQTFAPQHKLSVFIAGRVIIGVGQGVALSE